MSDVPFTPPPGIEAAVQQHLDVVHELRETRVTLNAQAGELRTLAKAVIAAATRVDQLADGRTEDSYKLLALERSQAKLVTKVDGVERKIDELIALAKELRGLPRG